MGNLFRRRVGTTWRITLHGVVVARSTNDVEIISGAAVPVWMALEAPLGLTDLVAASVDFDESLDSTTVGAGLIALEQAQLVEVE